MNQNEIRGNLDTGLLKIIALACMVIDHVGVRLMGNATEWRLIGRIAFPLYLWCMVVGACYTHSPARYALRLLAVGLISQPCFMLGLNHGWNQLNVFFTLLLGYLGIWGMRENRYGSPIWAPLLALAVPCFVSMDYGWRGVLLAMLLYAARKNRGAVAAVMVAFCLFWGQGTRAVQDVFGLSLHGGLFELEIVKSFLKLQTLALLALPLMLWPRTKRTPFPKVAAYAAYPGHLLILWGIQLALGVTTLQDSLRLLIP